jgi:hypothetical protein
MAFNLLEEFNFSNLQHNSPQHLHLLIEVPFHSFFFCRTHNEFIVKALRLSFADTRWYVADPKKASVPVKEMLSKEYATSRRKLIQPNKSTIDIKKGSPTSMSNTVYFCVVDEKVFFLLLFLLLCSLILICSFQREMDVVSSILITWDLEPVRFIEWRKCWLSWFQE